MNTKFDVIFETTAMSKPRDLLQHRTTNDIERARLNRAMRVAHNTAHNTALAAELRAQERAKGNTQ